MTPEAVLALPARTLEQSQREAFFEQGYLFLPAFVAERWIGELRPTLERILDDSRRLSADADDFVLETGHSESTPRLRRLKCAADHYPALWTFASQSALPDAAADLVGPSVKFRECSVNFKAPHGPAPVKWHQDNPFYPHSNRSPLVMLTYVEHVDEEMGPLQVIPGSHHSGLFDHYDEANNWTGRVSDADLASLPLHEARSLCGPAGSVIVLHGAMVHGSARNASSRARPVVLCGYTAADAFPLCPLATVSRYTGDVIRGERVHHAHVEAGELRLPPDWSKGYTSIYDHQKA